MPCNEDSNRALLRQVLPSQPQDEAALAQTSQVGIATRAFAAKPKIPSRAAPAKPDLANPSQSRSARGPNFDFNRIPVHSSAPLMVRPKLTVGAAGDSFEQEADRIADQVMRMPDPRERSPVAPSNPERSPAQAEQIQTKSMGASDSGGVAAPPIVHEVLNSPGQPLDAATRDFFEPRFGHDFTDVRVHADEKAAESSAAINAKTYTVGRDIAFGLGEYAPQTNHGRRLLSHELAHTLQNRAGGFSESRAAATAVRRQERTGDDPNKPGHKPAEDYAWGTITAKGKTYLLQSDHTKKVLDNGGKHPIYFNEEDAITKIGASANDMWVEVKGTGHFMKDKSETSVPNAQGWIPRRSTNMTLGLFEGLDIRDKTPKSGPGGISEGIPMEEVTAIVVHQTDSDTEDDALGVYAGRAKEGGTKGAHYLIGEKGQLHLVVPINEKVSHVGKSDRPVRVKKPKVADPMAVTPLEMEKTLNQIDEFFKMPNVTNFISKNQLDFWLALAKTSSQQFYDTLEASGWQVNVSATNLTSIGIEVVHRHTTLDFGQHKSAKVSSDTTQSPVLARPDMELSLKVAPAKQASVDAFLESVTALNFSPDLKEQLLKSKERAEINAALKSETTSADVRVKLQARLTDLNIALFMFMKANEFIVYEDISGAQKYSLWLLVSKLAQHYGLDPKRRVVGHEDVSHKHLGEGQNEAEFIHAMTDFVANVKQIDAISKIAPSKESREAFKTKWKSELAVVASIEKGETDNKDVTAFFENFYARVAAFNKSGALQFIKLKQRSDLLDKR